MFISIFSRLMEAWRIKLEQFKRLLVNHLSPSLSSVCHPCFCCDVLTRRDSCSLVLTPPKTLITNTHTVTHAHLSLLLPLEFHHSLALLWNPAHQFLAAPRICQLAWQPTGPHASRGVTYAPLFVSQNNIRSPIVFPVPHLLSPTLHPLSPGLHSLTARDWNFWPNDFWFQRNVHRLLCKPSWSHYVPETTGLWKS